jgi:hypothetical protein
MFPQQVYQGPNVVPMIQLREKILSNTIPSIFPSLLGVIQMFLWIAIVILEIISIYYDARRGTVYAGLWCSTVFFVTWVSMFCYGKSQAHGIIIYINHVIVT